MTALKDATAALERLAPSRTLADGALTVASGEWSSSAVERLLDRVGSGRAVRTTIDSAAGGLRSHSLAPLSLHQEDYHLARRPQVLLLLCLTSDVAGGNTTVASVDVERIGNDPETRPVEVRFFRQSAQEWTPWRPLVEREDEEWWPRIALPDEHRRVEFRSQDQAIDVDICQLVGPEYEVAWQPGLLIAIDNRRAVHGRRPMSGGRRTLERWAL